MSIAKKFYTVSGLTVVSRIFGVVREALLSHYLGACAETDAFLIAFKFPSFFRKCFAEGGFQSIFVPYFSGYTTSKDWDQAKSFLCSIHTLMMITMVLISVLVFILAPQFVTLMAPGFAFEPEKFALAIEFTRIIFPSVIFIAISSIYSSILISQKQFFQFGLAPIIVNIILIISLILGENAVPAGRRISFGVLLASLFQYLFLSLWTKHLGFIRPAFKIPKMTQSIKEFLKKLSPVVIGAGVAQINIFADSCFGSFLPTGSISYLYYADRFIQFPLAIFGISMATILLPEISECFSQGKFEKACIINKKAVIFMLRMTIPSVMIIISLSYLLINILYGHGKFLQSDVKITSSVLSVFALGIPAYVLSKIFASILFAQKNSSTPMKAAVISIISNIILNFLLIKPFGVIGLAFGTSIAGFINALVMYSKVKITIKFDKKIGVTFAKILFASIGMFIVIFFLNDIISRYTKNFVTSEVFLLILLGGVGMGTYAILLFLFKDSEFCDLVHKLRNKIISRNNGS